MPKHLAPTTINGIRIYNPHPTIDDAIKMAHGLNFPDFRGHEDSEYVRGQVELIIDLFAVEDGMDSRWDIEDLIHSYTGNL